NAAVPAPTVASISRPSGPAAGGTSVSIVGTGFLAGAVVTIGGSQATAVTVVSSSSITATTSAHAAGGAVNVVVTNPGGQSGTCVACFTYTAAVAAIAASPSPITAGNDLSVTVSGIGAPTGGDWIALQPVGYPDGSYIAWRFTGGIASGTLTLTVPASATAGSYNVRLFLNNSNTSTATSNTITVNAAASTPTIASSPSPI